MRKETFGGLEVRINGGSDGDGGGEGPAVVLLHGFGAGGDDLVGLGRGMDAPPGTRFVFPVGPLPLAPGLGDSRAWWMLDPETAGRASAQDDLEDLSRRVPEGLDAARRAVLEMLEVGCDALKVPRGQLMLGGFSQGAMLAMDVALHAERSLAGIVLLSASLLAEERWVARLPSLAGTPVFQSHGRQDPLLSFAMAERLRSRLEEAGLRHEWVPFRGGHEITPSVLHCLEDFTRRALAAWT